MNCQVKTELFSPKCISLLENFYHSYLSHTLSFASRFPNPRFFTQSHTIISFVFSVFLVPLSPSHTTFSPFELHPFFPRAPTTPKHFPLLCASVTRPSLLSFGFPPVFPFQSCMFWPRSRTAFGFQWNYTTGVELKFLHLWVFSDHPN